VKQNRDFRWWEAQEAHTSAFGALRHIEERDQEREGLNIRHMKMYGNHDIIGYRSSDMAEPSHQKASMSLNVVKAVSDTAVAQIARAQSRAVFLTDEGNRSLRRKARLLTRFVDGVNYAGSLHMKAPQVLLDACVIGQGCLKVYRKEKEVCFERVFPGELFVDPAEGMYQRPQTLYQRKYVHKDVLIGMFPEQKGFIMNIQSPSYDNADYYNSEDLDGMVEVVEAWKLPTGETPGSHLICVENATLAQEDWEHDRFPFIFIRWSPKMMGFWAQGIAEELTGIQVEINRILKRIQKAFQLLAVPWVLVEAGSKVQKAHLNNEIGAMIPYVGTPPIVKPNQTISPEVFQHLSWLYQRAFDHVGVSPFMAAGDKPSGVDSGVGIREAVEVQSGRFAMKIRAYEEFHLEVARWVVELGKEIAEEYPDFSISAPRDRYTVENVPWKDVEMEADQYVLRVFPASALPMESSGRLSTVTEMLNANLIDQETGKRLLDFPDLASEMVLDRAAMDAIDAMIESILDEGKPLVPEPFFDLQLFIKRAQAYYLKAYAAGKVPEARLRLLRNSMEAASTMQKAAMAEQMAMQAPLGAGNPLPTGPAGAPPTAIQPGDGAF